MSGSAPGRREVAYRLFAAEYDDAEFSYSESDEERAPNYVVTPTGARVNRLFAVGVLTEVDDVNPEMVRGRVVDPTGAFVTYAGQYQPDALAYLERADPPTFVALTGKARTFEPDDDDVVYSSVRPESVNTVDADTRDRWVVTAAERTIDRIGVMAAAIESDLTGDRLRAALMEADVDERLADGVALALEFYGTSPAYLGALRDVALDAARVVADERDEARGLDVAPDAAGGPDAPAAADLATLDLSGLPTTPVATDESDTPETDGPDDGGEADATTETRPASESEDASPTGDTESEPAATAAAADTETADGSAGADEPGTATPNTDAMAETEATATADTDTTASTDTDTSQDGATERDATVESDTGEAVSVDAESEPGEFDPGEFEMDDETRQEVEDEYGTEFSTADEVDGADIETPEPDDEPAEEPEPDAADEAESDTGAETDPEAPSGTDASTGTEAEAAEESSAEEAADVDLEDAVMDAMQRVGDEEGADREELVATVVDEHGADPDDVEAAIEDALMSGRCYEPSDGTLKAI